MLGLATIGQSPRDDVAQSMFGGVNHPALVQAGALDNLSDAEILALYPARGEHPLVTRLIDGTEVVIAKERVTPLMNNVLRVLTNRGATIVCVLCTGEFRGLTSDARIVYPERVLTGVVDAILPSGLLGVVMPHKGQRGSMLGKWRRSQRPVELSVVSPYDGLGSFECAAADLASAGAELIVLDCMGYSAMMQAEAQAAVAVPVMVANCVVGAILATMIPQLSGSYQNAVRL